jgi:microcystin-dependent protein
MAYAPREIKDRVAVDDDIFIVEDLGNNRIRLIPDPTHVSEPGTPINKALLQHMENHLVPPGAIIMWSGSINDIPVGWALCDGRNGTPDLRDRFIVGAGGSYNVGDTGGLKEVALTVAQMPQHNHTSTCSSTGSHAHSATFTGSSHGWNRTLLGASASWAYRASQSDEGVGVWGIGGASLTVDVPGITIGTNGSHQHTITVNSAGSGSAHENRPPYYALCFIMKL